MFSLATFDFLNTLSRNNSRPWFKERKTDYAARVRQPALDFIADRAVHLTKFAPNFRAIWRIVDAGLRLSREPGSNDRFKYRSSG
ncbi:MAG: DUF2461 family protein [Gallionella sp.]